MHRFTRCHVSNISSWSPPMGHFINWWPLIGQNDAVLASDWSDVRDLSETEVSSTSHVHIPGPCYNQSKIIYVNFDQSEAGISLTWPIRSQYCPNLANQKPVSPVTDRLSPSYDLMTGETQQLGKTYKGLTDCSTIYLVLYLFLLLMFYVLWTIM